MNIGKALSADSISLELKARDKDGIIEELVDLLMASGRLNDREAVLKAIDERERKMSTGMPNGVAIPHGKTDRVECLVAAFGLQKAGVDFSAPDGQPSTIFVATISPDSRTGPHIQFLAEVSRHLNDPSVRRRILSANTREEILQALSA